jgi:hypothetical protein
MGWSKFADDVNPTGRVLQRFDVGTCDEGFALFGTTLGLDWQLGFGRAQRVKSG